MRNGMRFLLAVLAAAIAAPAVRAGDDNTQIMLDVKIVRVDDACFEKVRSVCTDPARKYCSHCRQTAPAENSLSSTLTTAQVARVLEYIQADSRSRVVSTPRLVTLNDSKASFQVAGSHTFVTGVRASMRNGESVLVPSQETIPTGTNLTIRPCLTPDRKSVVLQLDASFTEVDSASPQLIPVSTTMTPVFEGGAQGAPIPLKLLLQQPTLTTLAVNKVDDVAIGQTALLYDGRWTSVEQSCCEVPVLCDLPVIGELFRCKSCDVSNDHLLVLVTPQIICDEAACDVPAARELPPCFDLPIMCEEPIAAASYRTEECIPVAPKPVRAPTCTQACPATCAPFCPAQCPQAFQGQNAAGAWCPAACPCPTACPCPAPTACCPLTSAMNTPPCAPAAHCAFVLVPVHQFGWMPAQMPMHAFAPYGMPVPTPVSMPATMAVRLTAGEEQSPRTPANPQVAKMLAKYQRACEAGDTEKARKLAGKCLLLDPTCFAR